MSVFVWVMLGIAVWHFAVLVPDKFTGGIIGAFLAAVAGALIAGYLLPSPGVPADNPPGLNKAIWPIPGAVISLALLYAHGARRERKADDGDELMRRAPRSVALGSDASRPERRTRAASEGQRAAQNHEVTNGDVAIAAHDQRLTMMPASQPATSKPPNRGATARPAQRRSRRRRPSASRRTRRREWSV